MPAPNVVRSCQTWTHCRFTSWTALTKETPCIPATETALLAPQSESSSAFGCTSSDMLCRHSKDSWTNHFSWFHRTLYFYAALVKMSLDMKTLDQSYSFSYPLKLQNYEEYRFDMWPITFCSCHNRWLSSRDLHYLKAEVSLIIVTNEWTIWLNIFNVSFFNNLRKTVYKISSKIMFIFCWCCCTRWSVTLQLGFSSDNAVYCYC